MAVYEGDTRSLDFGSYGLCSPSWRLIDGTTRGLSFFKQEFRV